ncbi:MAG TPA: hypothetical protein DDW52_21800 [Planctomycetaceae bacterium]|nr:hypothetical protein [Planctomycetaceae bacterium]
MQLLDSKVQARVEERVKKSLSAYQGPTVQADELRRYVNRALQLGRADLAAEIVEAEASESDKLEPDVVLERIINESQLTGVAFFYRGILAARAIGRVVIGGGGFGTGFMISPSLMMTNNHVLETSQSAAASTIEFDFARDLSGNLMKRQTFRLSPQNFFRTNSKIDYSVVAVEATNSEQHLAKNRGWLHLIRESGKAVIGERLNIIQHPDARPQMIALRENTLIGVDGPFLHYSTDTRPGSSGSPVMNDQFQLAALHHAGVPKRDTNGHLLKRNGRRFRAGDDPGEIAWIANEGARVSQIVKDLLSQQLSEQERSLIDEAFIEAPLDTGEMLPEPPADGGSGNRSGPTGGVVGSDGIARWNFQLTFGPTDRPCQTGSQFARAGDTLVAPSSAAGANKLRAEEEDSYFDSVAEAEAAERYYEAVDRDANPNKLYQALSKLVIDSHDTVFGYRTARHSHLYPNIDRHPDGNLRSVYSGEPVDEELIQAEIARFEEAAALVAAENGLESSDLSTEQLENIDLVLESSGPFNCEHVVPQSWFDKKQPMKADLHHLFTCEPGCNSFRSNIPYWDFDDEEAESLRAIEVAVEMLDNLQQEGSRAACGVRDGRKFEPDANKGAVARATLYFLLRYPGLVGDIKTGSKSELTKSRLEILLDWSDAEPPSKWEKHRNAEIAKVQGNRNPLIDHPEWARDTNFNLGFG